jgi:hypothetical protein
MNNQGCSLRRFCSNCLIFSACCKVRPISSNPFSKQCLRKASTSNLNSVFCGVITTLFLEIYRQTIPCYRFNFFKQMIHLRCVKHNWQQANLKTIIKKDIGKTGSNDDAKTIILKRPRRVFAARSATKIGSCQQYLRPLIARLDSTQTPDSAGVAPHPYPAPHDRDSAIHRISSDQSRNV